MTTIELLADGRVAVEGMSIDDVRARLEPRAPGRPPGPEITDAQIRAAIAELCEFDVEWTRLNLATAAGVSTKRLGPAVDRLYGSWAKLAEFRRARHPQDGGHEDHRDPA